MKTRESQPINRKIVQQLTQTILTQIYQKQLMIKVKTNVIQHLEHIYPQIIQFGQRKCDQKKEKTLQMINQRQMNSVIRNIRSKVDYKDKQKNIRNRRNSMEDLQNLKEIKKQKIQKSHKKLNTIQSIKFFKRLKSQKKIDLIPLQFDQIPFQLIDLEIQGKRQLKIRENKSNMGDTKKYIKYDLENKPTKCIEDLQDKGKIIKSKPQLSLQLEKSTPQKKQSDQFLIKHRLIGKRISQKIDQLQEISKVQQRIFEQLSLKSQQFKHNIKTCNFKQKLQLIKSIRKEKHDLLQLIQVHQQKINSNVKTVEQIKPIINQKNRLTQGNKERRKNIFYR